MMRSPRSSPLPPSTLFFFFNDTATPEIYTLSLHDALPILTSLTLENPLQFSEVKFHLEFQENARSEENTSELQSTQNLVCRLLLEKKSAHFTTPVTSRGPTPTASCAERANSQ